MEALKAITAMLSDLWLALSALALLVYYQIRIGFRVGRLEDKERETKAMVKAVDDKLDKIYLHLITHTISKNPRRYEDDSDYEDRL